jgi:hypothetical protein
MAPAPGPASPTNPSAPPQPAAPDDGGPVEPGGEIVRPIQDFLVAQGTYCFPDETGNCQLYLAPISNYLSWFTRELGPRGTTVAIDYAGIANTWMQQQTGRSAGTSLSGRVTERVIGDGQSHVTVELFGQDVMAYAVDHANLAGPLFWGARPFEVGAGQAPGTGSMRMEIRFTHNAPGGPLPDLLQIIRQPQPGQHLESVMLSYSGKGEFGEAYGKGRVGGTLSLTYDGSRGPIMPFHPEDRNTPPVGESMIALEAF